MYASRRRNRTDHVSARAGARCDSSRAVLGPVSSGLLISILICRVRSFAFMVFLRIHDFILDDWSFFIFGNLLSPSRAVVLVEELLTEDVGFPANRCKSSMETAGTHVPLASFSLDGTSWSRS